MAGSNLVRWDEIYYKTHYFVLFFTHWTSFKVLWGKSIYLMWGKKKQLLINIVVSWYRSCSAKWHMVTLTLALLSVGPSLMKPTTNNDQILGWVVATDLEKLNGLSLQSLRRQSGERWSQALLTEAQSPTPPKGRFWDKPIKKAHLNTHKKYTFKDKHRDWISKT